MANFPSNPSNGDTHAGFTYSSSVGAWKATAGVSTTLSNTAPTSPSNGDLWWNTNTSKLYISYDDGSSTQWVQAAVPGATGAAGAAGSSVTSYANSSIFPSSGNSVGDFAFATNTKAVYIWDGSEWDRISAGVDESPIITTEPSTSVSLNANGSPTTVTMVASDPEGFDITYGVAYNTAGSSLPSQLSTATTVNSNGVFTFTPTSNTSLAGSFKARLSASDGVKAVTRLIDFSLSFYDALDALNDGSCIALYKLNGNGDDLSGNHNATGYFTGSSSGFDNSIYKYDGSLNVSSTVLDLPDVRTSYPITVSAWMRPNNISASFGHLLNMTMGSSQRLVTGFAPRGGVYGLIIAYGGSNHWYFTPTTAFVANTWYHIIFSIAGSNNSNHAVYINGSADVTAYNDGGSAGGSAGWALGGNASGAERFQGHIDHVRVFNKALSSAEAATLYSNGG